MYATVNPERLSFKWKLGNVRMLTSLGLSNQHSSVMQESISRYIGRKYFSTVPLMTLYVSLRVETLTSLTNSTYALLQAVHEDHLM